MRGTYGVDTVVLMTGDFSDPTAGRAWAQRSPGPHFAPRAVGVAEFETSVLELVVTHEAGHILGMEHDPYNAPPPEQASFPWSFGYTATISDNTPGFHTVMGYRVNCGPLCTPAPYFSTPLLAFPDPPYNGLALGIADERDNARTASLLGPGNSQFYPETDAIFVGDLEYMP